MGPTTQLTLITNHRLSIEGLSTLYKRPPPHPIFNSLLVRFFGSYLFSSHIRLFFFHLGFHFLPSYLNRKHLLRFRDGIEADLEGIEGFAEGSSYILQRWYNIYALSMNPSFSLFSLRVRRSLARYVCVYVLLFESRIKKYQSDIIYL
ncbi:uncharacterized protein LOC120186669 isoform X3 [Hibiscus syriacus]|uniref:uncharacterized protein LOC120186669 isoform X3 n=1 Tax=Hibiscus syriacus TaxID=106335 RepID=UPI0019205CA4|nr:uncharacterized protein LOC120186669 isoform X3 [Hibiscus syriacus]